MVYLVNLASPSKCFFKRLFHFNFLSLYLLKLLQEAFPFFTYSFPERQFWACPQSVTKFTVCNFWRNVLLARKPMRLLFTASPPAPSSSSETFAWILK